MAIVFQKPDIAELLRPKSPWIPEIRALFDECKAVAPGNAYEMIGYVEVLAHIQTIELILHM